MKYEVDLPLIMDAVSYFDKLGYTPTSVPYIIEKRYTDLTKPEGVHDQKEHLGLSYVASAEQSFIKMLLEGDHVMRQPCLQALTPCFRPELNLSDSHQQIFLKLELFIKGDYTKKVLADVQEFYIFKGFDVKIVETHDGYDLELNGIEIGSYGTREVEGNVFTYGTGLAEPRFSYARSLK